MRIEPGHGPLNPKGQEPAVQAAVPAEAQRLALPSDAYRITEGRPHSNGVGRHWMTRLPSVLRFAMVGALRVGDAALDWVKTQIFRRPEPAAPGASDPRGRAEATWQTIERRYGIPGMPGVFAESDHGKHGLVPATVWPHGQAVAAALDIAQLTGDYTQVDATMRALSGYLTKGAYAPMLVTTTAKRLWDDNAWIGLDFMQAYAQTGNRDYLAHAEALFPFMQSGLHKDGGIYWEERNERMTRNACANAPAAQYALRLYQATKKPEYLAFAKNTNQFLNEHLRSPEGLYYDHLGDDGKLDKTIWSYNQGAAIGASLLMHQVTGDPADLERARETANAALEYFSKDDRLWKQPPAFNAILLRNLLALDAVAPDPRYREVAERYVERVWTEGRDPRTGELNRGGIGRYDPPGLLDQAAIAQLNALLAWPKDKLHMVG